GGDRRRPAVVPRLRVRDGAYPRRCDPKCGISEGRRDSQRARDRGAERLDSPGRSLEVHPVGSGGASLRSHGEQAGQQGRHRVAGILEDRGGGRADSETLAANRVPLRKEDVGHRTKVVRRSSPYVRSLSSFFVSCLMHELPAVLIDSLLAAGLYATMSYGLAVIYGVMRIINLAHPAILIPGAYTTFTLFTRFGLDPFLSLL